MAISVGDKLPNAALTRIGENGPEFVDLESLLAGRKVVIFGLPGAFTTTCSTAHLPSFMRVRDRLAEKGVDEVICLSVNDPFVMKVWGETSGATGAGITMLADAFSEFTKAIGMEFDVPITGFRERSRRYSLVAEDGLVTILNPEVKRGTCEISGGENLLAQL